MNTEDTCGSEQSIEGSRKKTRQKPTCTLCKNHGIIELYSEGHKTNCPGQYCMCTQCNEKRKAQKYSATVTRKNRAKVNERLIQKRQEERQKENHSLVLTKDSSEGSSKQVPFLIDSANKLLIENWRKNGLLIEEVTYVLSSEELNIKTKERERGLKRQRNMPKANQQKKNMEEIIFPKDLEDLLRYTVYSCCPTYGFHIINDLLKDIVATILQYAHRSTADAEITLNDAKNRIYLLICKIRELQYGFCYSVYHQSSNTVEPAVTHGCTPSYMLSHLNGPERPHGPERLHGPERPQSHPYTFPYILNQYTSEYALTSHLNLLHSDLLHITNRLPMVSEVKENNMSNPKRSKSPE